MLSLVFLSALALPAAGAQVLETFESAGMKLALEKLGDGGGAVWGFDFLPGGDILFTLREGRFGLLDAKTGKIRAVTGAPRVVAKNQGGLLDLVLHPDFAANKLVYITYSEEVEGGYTTALARGVFDGAAWTPEGVLFRANRPGGATHHFGSRLAFAADGALFMSVGDRGERDLAQDLSAHNGKILRMKDDGGSPDFYSWGHRNPQGLAFDPKTGTLYAQEHGPRGGDEINVIRESVNYGWPVITYGKEYYGPSIGEGTRKKGMEQPLHYWVPSIAPSGLAVYRGTPLSAWDGNLFSGALKHRHLNRLVLKDGKVVDEERLFGERNWRVRCVRAGPDGFLYFSTDSGEILRVRPR